MFSGKSEELIRRVTRSAIAQRPVQVFKPALDDRYSDREIVSHSRLSVLAEPLDSSEQLLHTVEDSTEVIGIDEAQFLDDGLTDVVDRLAAAGKQVVVAGLDLDYLRRPFEPIPTLCGRAEYVTKTLAVCHRCGGPALYTQRLIRSEALVVLGETGDYEARCRSCYNPEEGHQEALGLA